MKKCFYPFILLLLGSIVYSHAQDPTQEAFAEQIRDRFSVDHSGDLNDPALIELLNRYRGDQSVPLSVTGLTGVQLHDPVCELHIADYDARSSVPPPANFDPGGNGRALPDDDCSNIEVTYNFPDDFSEERRQQFIFAFEYAVAIWESQISSTVPVRIQANLQPLGPGILGSAGANRFWTTGGPFFPDALIDQIFGLDVTELVLGIVEPDIICNFNTDEIPWYLGTDALPPPGTFDFSTVVLHELCHGLGFIGSAFADSDLGLGVYGLGDLPVIFDTFVEDGNGIALSQVAPPGVVSPALEAYFTSENLFINAPTAVAALGGMNGKIFAPSIYNPGSSFSHWDEATFGPGDENSLMSPFLGASEAIHDPGPATLGMFFDHGWTLSENCEGPEPTDLSEPCLITGISLDPNFRDGQPVCDIPGEFSEEGGAFGPVGSHVVSLRIDGINPFNQPKDLSQYKVRIFPGNGGGNAPELDILFAGYEFLDGEQYFILIVGGVPSKGNRPLTVEVELEPGCTFKAFKLYRTPDCKGQLRDLNQNTLQVASRDTPSFTAFPNPTTGAVTVQVGEVEDGRLMVFDGVGRMIRQDRVAPFQTVNLNLEKQQGGMFYLRLVGKDFNQTERIMLVK